VVLHRLGLLFRADAGRLRLPHRIQRQGLSQSLDGQGEREGGGEREREREKGGGDGSGPTAPALCPETGAQAEPQTQRRLSASRLVDKRETPLPSRPQAGSAGNSKRSGGTDDAKDTADTGADTVHSGCLHACVRRYYNQTQARVPSIHRNRCGWRVRDTWHNRYRMRLGGRSHLLFLHKRCEGLPISHSVNN
jgi:hypothetical protein